MAQIHDEEQHSIQSFTLPSDEDKSMYLWPGVFDVFSLLYFDIIFDRYLLIQMIKAFYYRLSQYKGESLFNGRLVRHSLAYPF